ncbi:multicopper oxidase family protein [Phaeobacter sp.]|uniref:multicopper oxidase family protein n=1 Tax=Phaeobacter sp. TaxID=1902409 RepID=UPI0025D5A11A|nr:multicopper oxidase family protein [Phaeobacter sp.]
MVGLSRRQFLAGTACAVAGGTGAFATSWTSAAQEIHLQSRETAFNFGPKPTNGLISLADNAPPPILRLKQGQPAALNYTNGLADYSTMHWHGIRLPNDMDGVPYLTQMPIAQGETFQYRFTPPDAGTYWYHPHCMTMSQMAKGLTGVLIVDEAEDQGFDADISLNLKDFRLAEDGSLLPYFTARGAARAGTFGNIRTTNWQQEPSYDVPAGGLIRLRFVVSDTTRVHKLYFPEVAGKIIAWDGHPVNEEIPWPTKDAPLWLGPGQRVDVAIVAPDQEGEELLFNSLIGTNYPFEIARLRSIGHSLSRQAGDIPTLPKNPIEAADPATSNIEETVFGWSPEGDGTNNGLCGSNGYIFWSINRNPWKGDAVANGGPVVSMALGDSYILRLRNESPNLHPIHLHGLVFKPIRSNLRHIPANYTDTVLLLKDEIIDVLVRADNPGQWAFHCHVIEHQKTGLSGFVSVG